MISTSLRAAVLLCDGFQELEFWYPVLRFREQQLAVQVIGADEDRTYSSRLQYPVNPDGALAAHAADGFDVVVVPGADYSSNAAVRARVGRFVAQAHASGAVIGMTSSAIGLLGDAGLASGLDVAVPGGPRVVCDGRVVTAWDADDLPDFFPALCRVATVKGSAQ